MAIQAKYRSSGVGIFRTRTMRGRGGKNNRGTSVGSRGLAILLLLISICAASADGPWEKRIYIAPDDHTDFMWKADSESYDVAMVEMLNYYLREIENSVMAPSHHQARWNCDGAYWIWAYQKRETVQNFSRLIRRIRDKHISVPLNTLVSCYGAAPLEGIIRGMFPAGSIERQHQLELSLAVAMENQTLPYGLGAVWAGCGAKYSWRGICGCATKVADARHRQHEVYWWLGPDGSKILMKWNSMLGANTSIGGYAEARDPLQAIEFVESDPDFKMRYPYKIVGIFGKGWDDLLTRDTEIVRAAKTKTTASRKVIVSNEEDYFADFEKTYGNQLPHVSVSYGNEWDIYCASMAETTARVKRSVEKLRSAEALATYVALKNRQPYNDLKDLREAAWMSLGLYWEHNWTADGPVSREARANWQNNLADHIDKYANSLFDSSRRKLSQMIRKTSGGVQFFVFNPLSWQRSDYADLPWAKEEPVRILDTGDGKEVPSQFIIADGRRFLRIFASRVPGFGYKVFELISTPNAQRYAAPPKADKSLENAFYKIKINGNGSIDSLIDKRQSDRQYVRRINQRTINDLGGNEGSVELENFGPVSTTVLAKSASPLKHETRITIFRDIPRIEIKNEIRENFGSIHTWAFSFALNNPDTWHEETGAIIRAKLQEDGGHYSSRNSRYDWLTLNHFVDMHDQDAGIILSNSDCSFMRLGDSKPSFLDTKTPQVSMLAGGQMDGPNFGIKNQGGCNHFTQRFALKTYNKAEKKGLAESAKFALEHQNPLVAQIIEGGDQYPAKQHSILTIGNPDVFLWAAKPSEDETRSGIVLRFWNLSNRTQPANIHLSTDSIISASKVTHLENRPRETMISNGRLIEGLRPWQLSSYFLATGNH